MRQKGACDVRVITPNAFSYGSPDGRTPNLPVLESLLAALRRAVRADGRLFFGTFPSEVRPEHVDRPALELVRRFANNDHLVIGAQTGSDRLLERCRRGDTVADVLSAVSRTLAAGIKPHVDFIFGLPGETDEDLNSTIGAVRELAAMRALIHAHAFMPLPQTLFAGQDRRPPPCRPRGAGPRRRAVRDPASAPVAGKAGPAGPQVVERAVDAEAVVLQCREYGRPRSQDRDWGRSRL
jgi:radical SAM superfamily enzyme YgiQ (UPF0313 family)